MLPHDKHENIRLTSQAGLVWEQSAIPCEDHACFVFLFVRLTSLNVSRLNLPQVEEEEVPEVYMDGFARCES